MSSSISTYSKIQIISNALVLCGEKPLSSLNEDRYGATVGSNLFEVIYESELQSNRWRFAMKKQALSRLNSSPLNEFTYAYQMPTDSLLPIGVYPRAHYEIYGKHLYSDETTVELEHMFKPVVTDLPAYFVLLLTYAMARDMIKPITESDTAVEIMAKKYKKQRDIAMHADAQGRPNRAIIDSPFTDVR